MCGRRFKKIGNQKYCNSCDGSYEKIDKKTIVCIDCGEEFEVDAKDTKSIRCEKHQHEFDNAIKSLNKYRKNSEEKRLIYHIKGLFLAEPKAEDYVSKGYEYSNIEKMDNPSKKYDYYVHMVDLKNDIGHIEKIKCKRIYNKTILSLIMDLKQDDYTHENGIKTIKIKSRAN